MKEKWDGYIHINGHLQVKRMFNGESSIEKDSPFVARYIEPVKAENRDEAIKLLQQKASGEIPDIGKDAENRGCGSRSL